MVFVISSSYHLYFFSYVAALEQANLAGVTDRPIFTVYPAYDPNKPRTAQGFNLMEASDRVEAISTILQLRHNIICSCPIMKQSRDDSTPKRRK